jgi:hypothetical protein
MLAHVELAWAYSFQGVIGRLLTGQRIGQATDMFNLRWAGIATELSEMQGRSSKGGRRCAPQARQSQNFARRRAKFSYSATPRCPQPLSARGAGASLFVRVGAARSLYRYQQS